MNALHIVATVCTIDIRWASMRENLIFLHANNKGADQPAHSRSLLSAVVVRSLERIVINRQPCSSLISIF